MDIEYPLRELNLVATSVADELGFIALSDIARVAAHMNSAREWRLIGGHMLTLHAQRWGLGRELYRETTDVDIGIAAVALNRIDTVGLLNAEGYQKVGGCRFQKTLEGISEKATIDVLVPSYASRPRKGRKIGGLTTTEVLGLATALQRKAVEVLVKMSGINGKELIAKIMLPDEISGFGLKVAAFGQRSAGKDAVDVWRCFEIMYRAGISVGGESEKELLQAKVAAENGFAKLSSPMMASLVEQQSLSKKAAQQRYTRIQALLKHVL